LKLQAKDIFYTTEKTFCKYTQYTTPIENITARIYKLEIDNSILSISDIAILSLTSTTKVVLNIKKKNKYIKDKAIALYYIY